VRDDDGDDDGRLARVHDALRTRGAVEQLSRDPDETRLWLDYELASFVETRIGHAPNPRSISTVERAEWLRLATDEGKLYGPHTNYSVPYWVLAGAERVGTVMLSKSTLGNASPSVASLYIHPAHRRRGYAAELLRCVYAEILEAGLDGLRLDTNWCWQPAVKFYLSLGMWVRGWKRDLVFAWRRDLAPWTIAVGGDEASFQLHGEQASRSGTAITARRVCDRLVWSESPKLEPETEMTFLAPGTFALALAVRGWPLICDDDKWHEQCERGWSDFGGPEGLAFKIRIWEAWARSKGWLVETPRIPGVDYPPWAELEAAWARRQTERDAEEATLE
jgi:GNAT superfamily N-acetyltransferase